MEAEAISYFHSYIAIVHYVSKLQMQEMFFFNASFFCFRIFMHGETSF